MNHSLHPAAVTLFSISLAHAGSVRTEPQVESLRLDPAMLAALHIDSPNGTVEFTGTSDPTAQPTVTATKRGSGASAATAQAALQAIEVFAESDGKGGQRIGWRWKGRKPLGSSAEVDFAISAPANTPLEVDAANGKVTVSAAAGEVQIKSGNGDVVVDSRGQRLDVEAHNGAIAAQHDGGDFRLVTHNGGVKAGLAGTSAIAGIVESHNGEIEVALDKSASSEISCETHNGQVHFELPVEATSKSHGKVRAKLGSGAGKLALSTHNGDIRVRAVGGL